MSEKIVNIINFVRATGFPGSTGDLSIPVKEEMKLNKKYGFKNTFLLQYDAIISEKFQKIFLEGKDDNTEIGIWLECVRPLVENVGLEWRGRNDCDWDWHVVPGFLMAYTNEEKKLLIDEAFAKFYEVFNEFPKSAGSWMLDSWSVEYMKERYNVKAFAICREQYGVDAYTLWGGYYNQGYYPSRNNILCPGQTESNTIKAPIFRMLGPDPIYCYDEEEFETGIKKGCATMEPVWEYGSTERIFNEYLKSYYDEECMDFAYTTIGQENSFSWSKIRDGLNMQLEKIDCLAKAGKVKIQTLSETGKWFSKTFNDNPTVSLISHEDWAGNGIKSIWYNCKNYRANLIVKDKKVYFRDINKFDENYCDRYKNEPCTSWNAMYDNLPIADGRLWNDGTIKSGLKIDTEILDYRVFKEDSSLVFEANNGKLKITLIHDKIVIDKLPDVKLYFERRRRADTDISVDGNTVRFCHNNYKYTVKFNVRLTETKNGYEAENNGRIIIYI